MSHKTRARILFILAITTLLICLMSCSDGKETQCSQQSAAGGAGKACAVRKSNHQRHIGQYGKTVEAQIDQAKRHAVFIGKIIVVSVGCQKRAVTAKTVAVQAPSVK